MRYAADRLQICSAIRIDVLWRVFFAEFTMENSAYLSTLGVGCLLFMLQQAHGVIRRDLKVCFDDMSWPTIRK